MPGHALLRKRSRVPRPPEVRTSLALHCSQDITVENVQPSLKTFQYTKRVRPGLAMFRTLHVLLAMVSESFVRSGGASVPLARVRGSGVRAHGRGATDDERHNVRLQTSGGRHSWHSDWEDAAGNDAATAAAALVPRSAAKQRRGGERSMGARTRASASSSVLRSQADFLESSEPPPNPPPSVARIPLATGSCALQTSGRGKRTSTGALAGLGGGVKLPAYRDLTRQQRHVVLHLIVMPNAHRAGLAHVSASSPPPPPDAVARRVLLLAAQLGTCPFGVSG